MYNTRIMQQIFERALNQISIKRVIGSSRLYLIGRPDVQDYPIKVGIATDPATRLTKIRPGSPFLLDVLYKTEMMPSPLTRALEFECHRRLSSYKLRSEWFDVARSKAIKVIETVIAENRIFEICEMPQERWLAA